jgi:hypothetical protein
MPIFDIYYTATGSGIVSIEAENEDAALEDFRNNESYGSDEYIDDFMSDGLAFDVDKIEEIKPTSNK